MDKGNPLKPTQFELQFVDSIDQVYLGKGVSEISGSQNLNLLPCYSFMSYTVGSSESVRHHRFCGKLQSFGSSLCFFVLKTQTALSCELSLVHHRWAVTTVSVNQGHIVH